MKRTLLALFVVLMAVQGCNSGGLKEDVKDIGQDIKNEVNKATD